MPEPDPAAPDHDVMPTAAAAAAGPAGPIAVGERIVALDVLRGLALLGILMVNVFTFGLPLMEAFAAPPADAGSEERIGYAIMRGGFQFKFMPMFSMLFGAGLAVQVARAAARGDAFVPRYLRRIGVLTLLGFLHATLLWYGDILFFYGVIGTGLLFVRKLKSETLITAGAVLIVVSGLLAGTCSGISNSGAFQPEPAVAVDDAAEVAPIEGATAGSEDGTDEGVDAGPDVDAEPRRGLDAMTAAKFNPQLPGWRDAEVLAYAEGPWADAAAFRIVTWLYSIIFMIFGAEFLVFGCFLLGAGLLRSGFFDPSASRRQLRVAILAIGIAGPLEIFSAWAAMQPGVGLRFVAEVFHPASGPGLAVGYVAAITWLVSRGLTRSFDAPIRAAGRAALSVYLGETIVGLAIFQWWGLGLFDSVTRLEMLGIAVAIWVGLTILATVWLSVFRFGPAEWAWRTLTYGSLQPMRRSATPRA